MTIKFVVEFAIWGGIGGLIGVLAKNGYFEIPYLRDKKIYLGGLQGVLFGVVAGLIGDSSAGNAFMWGIAGTTVIQALTQVANKQAECATRAISKKEDS